MLATWTLPGGFIADSFAYPIPERIPDPPVASYGYHDEVVFLATITPPADLETGRSVQLMLSADIVVCGGGPGLQSGGRAEILNHKEMT